MSTPFTHVPTQRVTGRTGPSEALADRLDRTCAVLAACRGLGRSQTEREVAAETEAQAVDELVAAARREDRAVRGSHHEAEHWAVRQLRLHRERLDCLERLARVGTRR